MYLQKDSTSESSPPDKYHYISTDGTCLHRLPVFGEIEGGFENILVIVDHFSRFAQAIPTKNQTATTTAKALFENFFLHYGFPARLHSDKGANFESKVIKKLCKLAGVLKTRTTPYHPMGNGMVERYTKRS